MPRIPTYQTVSTTEEAVNNPEYKRTQPVHRQLPQSWHDGPRNGVEDACGPNSIDFHEPKPIYLLLSLNPQPASNRNQFESLRCFIPQIGHLATWWQVD